MAAPTNEELLRRWADAIAAQDDDALGALRHRDWTMDYPQSGERLRGHANDRAMLDNWPGGRPSAQPQRVVGAEDRWVVTPMFTVTRVVGSGDFWWADGTLAYPDGSRWLFAAMFELRDGKVLRETWYFAAPFEAPAWRAQWVEAIS